MIGRNVYKTLKEVERAGGVTTRERFATTLVMPYTASNKLHGAVRTGYLLKVEQEFKLTDRGVRAIRVYEHFMRS